MNEKMLVDVVATKLGVTKKDTKAAIDAVFETIAEAMANGDVVSIPNFGKFSCTERAARTGRNPQTGEEIQIPASKSPKFKAGKALKDMINK